MSHKPRGLVDLLVSRGQAQVFKTLPACVNILTLLNVKVSMGYRSLSHYPTLRAIGGRPCLWGALSCRQWRTIKRTANEKRTQGRRCRCRHCSAGHHRNRQRWRKNHADQQHLTDRQFLSPCIRCRLTSCDGHIRSHPSSSRYQGESEATEDRRADDACTGHIQGSGGATATPDNHSARCRASHAIRLLPADQRGELL
jgi:hypothetical protein